MRSRDDTDRDGAGVQIELPDQVRKEKGKTERGL